MVSNESIGVVTLYRKEENKVRKNTTRQSKDKGISHLEEWHGIRGLLFKEGFEIQDGLTVKQPNVDITRIGLDL